MSLIKVRQRRKKNWIDARQGMSRSRLVTLLAITLVVIWYLGSQF
jgi:hypothetical protein